MLNLFRLKKIRNSAVARPLALALLVSALTVMPIGLPGTSNVAEAQSCWPALNCPNGSFNVGGLISSIDVTWTGGHHYLIKFNLASGIGTTGSCGYGHASWVRNYDPFDTNCGGSLDDTGDPYTLHVTVGFCPNTFVTDFRVYGYHPTLGPRRIHSRITINKSDFTYTGQTIYNYAPVAGC